MTTASVLPDVPPPDPPTPVAARVAIMAASAATGLLIGVLGAFVQADRWLVGTRAVPWGVVLVLLTLVSCVRGASWAARSRLAGVLLFAGWLLATIALAAESSSGDLAISGGTRQMAYLVGGAVLGAFALTLPLLDRRVRGES